MSEVALVENCTVFSVFLIHAVANLNLLFLRNPFLHSNFFFLHVAKYCGYKIF